MMMHRFSNKAVARIPADPAKMGRRMGAVALALLLALLSARLHAQTLPLEARLITTGDRVTVGDPIRLTVEVIHPAEYQAFVPELPQAWGEFDVRSRGIQETVDHGDGRATTRRSIEVALFAPGTYQTPPLEVKLSDPQGVVSAVTAAPVTVAVDSVLVENDDALRDIKPQASLPMPSFRPLIAAGTLFGLALLAAGGWVFYRQSRRRPIIDTRSPRQIALDELDGIETATWLQDRDYKLYYGAITATLRGYVQRQYGIATADRTTAELRGLIRNTSVPDEHAEEFIRLLTDADLVKFAEFSPSEDAARRMLEQSRALVIRTAADAAAQEAGDQSGGSQSNPPRSGVMATM